MRASWTDARLDDFRADVDRRFDKVEGDISELRGEMRKLRAEMKSGFEAVNRTMLHGVLALSAAYVAGFAAIITQL